MRLRNALGLAVLGGFGVLLGAASAGGDDFAPPPWFRAQPRAATAEWEFDSATNPAAPLGPLSNVGTKGIGATTTLAFVSGTSAGLGWGPGDGDGGWFFPDGGDIFFWMDNVALDGMVKHLWLQVTHTPGLGLSLFSHHDLNVADTGSVPGPVTTVVHGPGNTYFFWDMTPSPPFEKFRLIISGTGEVDEVVVDTVSILVPEPSTLALGAIGMMLATLVRGGGASARGGEA
jgi:hypothetical protein